MEKKTKRDNSFCRLVTGLLRFNLTPPAGRHTFSLHQLANAVVWGNLYPPSVEFINRTSGLFYLTYE